MLLAKILFLHSLYYLGANKFTGKAGTKSIFDKFSYFGMIIRARIQ